MSYIFMGIFNYIVQAWRLENGCSAKDMLLMNSL